MIGQIQRYVIIALAALAVAAIMAAVLFRARSAADSLRADAAVKDAQTSAAALRDAKQVIATERANAEKANKVAIGYENDKAILQARADKLAADLRHKRVELRVVWRDRPTMPEAGPSSAEPDATEQGRQDSAVRIVHAADQCDAQVKALQDFVRSERQ